MQPWDRADLGGASAGQRCGAGQGSRPGSDAGACAAGLLGPSGPEAAPRQEGGRSRRRAGEGTRCPPGASGWRGSSSTHQREHTQLRIWDGVSPRRLGPGPEPNWPTVTGSWELPKSAAAGGGAAWRGESPGCCRAGHEATRVEGRRVRLHGTAPGPALPGRASAHGSQAPDRPPSPAKPPPPLLRGLRTSSGRTPPLLRPRTLPTSRSPRLRPGPNAPTTQGARSPWGSGPHPPLKARILQTVSSPGDRSLTTAACRAGGTCAEASTRLEGSGDHSDHGPEGRREPAPGPFSASQVFLAQWGELSVACGPGETAVATSGGWDRLTPPKG